MRRDRALAASVLLGITQTIGYGTLYYSFSVLAPTIAEDAGISLTSLYGFFSLALAASGIVAPRAGRLMDAHHPALVMAFGSLVCAVLLALLSQVPAGPGMVVFIVLAEIASVTVLYEAAFVAAAHVAGEQRARRSIAGITFIAGFASTVFWPATQWLLDEWGWRATYGVFAVLHLAVCLPLHALLFRYTRAGTGAPDVTPLVTASPAPSRQVQHDQRRRTMIFAVLLAGFAANAFVISAVHLNLITLLGALGFAGQAATIGAFIGPAQVGARILEFMTAGRTSIHVPSIVSALALPLGLLVLLFAGPSFGLAVVFALIFGVGQGLAYVVRGVLPLQMFGRTGYGARMGKINAVRLYVSAAAPFILAAVLERFGTGWALAVITTAALASACAMIAVAVMDRKRAA